METQVSTAAPIAEAPISAPAPETSAADPSPQEIAPAKSESAPEKFYIHKAERQRNDAVDKAFDKVFGDDKTRDEQGRFKSTASESTAPETLAKTVPVAEMSPATKEITPAAETKISSITDAPSRFSADAKAAWATTPDPVKAEVNRAVSELETGLKQYQERYAPLKPYEDAAKQHNTTVEAALQNYVNLEAALKNTPEEGLIKVFKYAGLNPHEWAARILGQTPDQNAMVQNQTIIELRTQLDELKGQVQNVSGTMQQQQDAVLQKHIDEFAATAPRFDELRNDISFFLQTEKATTLQEAYQMAERLNPAPASTIAPIQQAKPDLKAQTQKGSLSTTGAPISGSNPAFRKPPKSAGDAVDRAFAQLGIS
jgi:hypothetical protein